MPTAKVSQGMDPWLNVYAHPVYLSSQSSSGLFACKHNFSYTSLQTREKMHQLYLMKPGHLIESLDFLIKISKGPTPLSASVKGPGKEEPLQLIGQLLNLRHFPIFMLLSKESSRKAGCGVEEGNSGRQCWRAGSAGGKSRAMQTKTKQCVLSP